MILVVGSTGQLGTAIVRKLSDRGLPVRAFVRETSNFNAIKRDGIELVFGDLSDRNSLDAACKNVDTIIATANAALPRQKRDSFKSVDDLGYANLIEAAKHAGVRHFIYTSALSTRGFDQIPIGRQKRLTEARLKSSGLQYTIFRADAFMDVCFAMMGSDLPIRGAEAATVERPFWFTSKFFNGVRNSIEKDGKCGVLGDGSSRKSYVCIDDVAEFHVRAVDNQDAINTTFDIGGPESISQTDVAQIFEKVLNRPLKIKQTPALIFKIGYWLLRFPSPAAANIMGLNYCTATESSSVDMTRTSDLFGVRLTSAEEFLRTKAGART
jgi:uncharacterized protein YbjT (DUF2867 family)